MCHVAEVNTSKTREHSSAGRAHALQAWGHRFEPCCSHQNMALWCSRLARQPVTLEVDGSSPFGVAIKSQICAMRKTTSSYASVAQLVEQWTENPRVVGSIPTGGTKFAGVAHPVERHLAKVEVASSSLVTRSIRYRGQVVRQESAKLSFASSNLAGTSKNRQSSSEGCRFLLITSSLFTLH